MRVQYLQQRRHGGRFDGEVEVDFRAALALGQAAQGAAFGQRYGQRVANQRHQHRHAIVQIDIGIAFVVQRLAQHLGLPLGRFQARLPIRPCSEVDVLHRLMQHVAEAAAHETRIKRRAVCGGRGGFRQGRFQRQFRASRFVGRRCWQFGGGRFDIVAGASIGMGQLGEAVHPPVMRHAPGQRTHGRQVTFHFGRQLRQRGRRLAVVDIHISMCAQHLQVTQQRRQPRPAEPSQIAHGDPQRVLGTGQAHIQQACIFGTLLAFALRGGRFPGLVLVELPVQLALAAHIHRAVRRGVRRPAVDADEGQEHQRILQALALVQGDDLHTTRVRFQAQQLLLVILVGIGHLSLQPVQQAMHAQRLRGGFLQ